MNTKNPEGRTVANRITLRAGTLLVVFAISGCAGFQLHDPERSKIASAARASYEQIKVLDVIAIERKNLEALLTEELKELRDNQRLNIDYALLALVNDESLMADTFAEAKRRLGELGFADAKAVRAGTAAETRRAIEERKLRTIRTQLSRIDPNVPVSECGKDRAALAKWAAALPEERQKRAQGILGEYEKVCAAALAAPAPPRVAGEIADAERALQGVRAELEKNAAAAKQRRAELAAAKSAYDAAVARKRAGIDAGPALEKEIQEKAADLANALKALKNVETGAIHEEQIAALSTLLRAAAAGKIDPAQKDVPAAALIAAQLPSLARDAQAIAALTSAPPVQGLLIQLRYQSSLAEYAALRQNLIEERIAILTSKRDTLVGEARLWKEFIDATCSYAVISAGRPHPESACDTFELTETPAGTDTPRKIECRISGAPIADCVLRLGWKAGLKGGGTPDARRQLYRGAAAYLRALSVSGLADEYDFREIDVLHREVLLTKQVALEAQDNLIANPLLQLDAFYQAGIKPAELADLLVKALGFIAVAIGAAQ